MSFQTLGLSPELLRALNDQGYSEATPVQVQAIPLVLAGSDLMASAQTGTGKTAAFVLPLLERLRAKPAQSPSRGRVRVLILTPTRELAAQVLESVRTYGAHQRPSCASVFGGVGMQPQVQALSRGVDFLVATPGRLLDHLERRTVDLSKVETLVLDEADRMLDMGFLPALKRVIAAVPRQRQTLLFSATFAEPIRALAQAYLNNPAEVQVASRNSVASTVTHRFHPVSGARKKDLLLDLLAVDSRRQTLIFTRTKHGADRLCRILDRAGFSSRAIHGNKTQGARTKALDDFKRGRATLLVATDIAARGLDIDQLPVVVNYDLPTVAEDYVHRIGRTGRAGAEGIALSLVTPEDVDQWRDILRLINLQLPLVPIEGYEVQMPQRSPAAHPGPRQPAPRQAQRAGQPRRSSNRGRSGNSSEARRPA